MGFGEFPKRRLATIAKDAFDAGLGVIGVVIEELLDARERGPNPDAIRVLAVVFLQNLVGRPIAIMLPDLENPFRGVIAEREIFVRGLGDLGRDVFVGFAGFVEERLGFGHLRVAEFLVEDPSEADRAESA
jgi:hypothetical protein